jgi:hypothetical protein
MLKLAREPSKFANQIMDNNIEYDDPGELFTKIIALIYLSKNPEPCLKSFALPEINKSWDSKKDFVWGFYSEIASKLIPELSKNEWVALFQASYCKCYGNERTRLKTNPGATNRA